jgi:PPP family 3-phenylpropionic acid transporter
MRDTSPLRLFAAVWFTYFASIGLFTTYAPLWFKDLGFSALAIGALASLQAWTRVIAPYGWGWLADHRGRRVGLLRLSVLLACAASLALALAGPLGLPAVVACVLFMYLSNGAVVPLAEAVVAHQLQTAQGMDTARYARVRVWGSIGFVASVLLFGGVLQATGVTAFPWFVVGMVGLLGLAVWRVPEALDAGHAEVAAASGALQVLRRPEVAWFFAGVFFTVLAHTSLYAFFSLYLDALGCSKAQVGLLWAVAAGMEIAFFWFQGRWFERVSLHGWLVLAAAVSSLRFGLMAAFGQVGWLLVLTQATHAITFAAQHAACIALVHRYFPGRLRGRGQALYSMLGYGCSGVLGGVAGGALIERHGHPAVFWAASAAGVLSMACLWRSRAHARAALQVAAVPS